jgi:hypothetical protein
MKNFRWGMVLLASLCCGTSQAAEFLVLDINADPNVATMTVADSSAITAGEIGHKLATLLYIHEGSEWDERKMDLDCTAPRWRELGGVRHHLDGSSAVESPDDDWTGLQDGTGELRIRDAVCAWPDKRPDAVTGELKDIIAQGSVLMGRMAAESQRERDDDK